MGAPLPEEAKAILRKVGITLIAVGVIDIAIMIWCIAHKQGYASCLNIFAIAAGTFMLRGNLKVIKKILLFNEFYLASFLPGALLIIFFVIPFDFWPTAFRLSPISELAPFLLPIPALMLFVWTYAHLISPAITGALDRYELDNAPNPFWYRRNSGFIIGLLFLAGVSFYWHKTAPRAAMEASAQYGPRYKYFATSINNGYATLTAYNSSEIRQVGILLK